MTEDVDALLAEAADLVARGEVLAAQRRTMLVAEKRRLERVVARIDVALAEVEATRVRLAAYFDISMEYVPDNQGTGEASADGDHAARKEVLP